MGRGEARLQRLDVMAQVPPPRGLHPMSEFDPSQPAILHDCRNDEIITWTGERHDHYVKTATPRPDGTVEYDGCSFDGWGNVLGG